VTSRFFIGIGNDNQPVTTKITSINFARLLIPKKQRNDNQNLLF